MGCDIHAKIEYRRFSDQWDNFAMDINLPRNYLIFGSLVDDHSRGPKGLVGVAPARDYPEDADSFWFFGNPEWSPDPKHTADHTLSWLTTTEYAKALENAADFAKSKGWKETAKDPFVDPQYHAVLGVMNTLEAAGMPCRLVFGFDN
jgi:hypothetical protein